jgi:hypothetical protein
MNIIQNYSSGQIDKLIESGSIQPQVDAFGNVKISSNQTDLDKSCFTFEIKMKEIKTKEVLKHYDLQFKELS